MFRPVSKYLRAASFFVAYVYILGNLLSFTEDITETALFTIATTYISIPAVVVSLGVQVRPRFKDIRVASYFLVACYVMSTILVAGYLISSIMILAEDFTQRLLLSVLTSYVSGATIVGTLFAGTQQSATPETEGLNQEKIS